MRRFVFLAALLLVASTALAQVPKPTVAIEQIAGPGELMPMERGDLKMDIRFDCAMFEGPLDKRTAHISILASHPSILVFGPLNHQVDTTPCWQSPQARFVEFGVKLDVAVSEVNQSSVERILTTVSVSAGSNMSPAPDDAEAETVIALIAPAPEPTLDAEVQDRAPAEEFAPGPALPLLALAGLGAARLRRP